MTRTITEIRHERLQTATEGMHLCAVAARQQMSYARYFKALGADYQTEVSAAREWNRKYLVWRSVVEKLS